MKTNVIVSNRDRIHLSGYLGADQFINRTRPSRESSLSRNTDHKVGWKNQLMSLRWHRLVNDHAFISVTMGTVGYDVMNEFRSREAITTDSSESFRSIWTSSIRDYTLRLDAEVKPARNHYLRFGGEIISHAFKPSSTQSTLTNQRGEQSRSRIRESTSFLITEYAIYLEDELRLFDNTSANLGIRYSGGHSDGKQASAVEPRASVKFDMTHQMDVKVSYAFVQQYLHRLNGAGSSISREVWIPFMSGIQPQTSSQIAIGASSRLPHYGIELTLEAYYKHLDDQIKYRLDTLPYQSTALGWANVVERGQGTAYGIELMVRRQNRRLNGWLNYTWSHSQRMFSGLNEGKSFHDNYDRRHDISIVGQYQVTQFTTVSASWVYSSGYPLWLPVGRYYDPINDVGWFEYGAINATRSPASHRLDLTARFTKQIKWGKRTFSLGLFNVYNRRNPMYVYPQANIYGTIRWERVSLLSLVPDFSYAIQF
ncbi:MAG: TonB-dependent receptor [Bacteroidetes bacterium]|nr:TonB-dependent receptor [Bacteroidota bacterium]